MTITDWFCFVPLFLKVLVCRLIWPTCGFVGCKREAADWTLHTPVCGWHFDRVMQIRREEMLGVS
jgi:hypothetical protein